MTRQLKVGIGILFFSTLAIALGVFIHGHPLAILDPKGTIALQERNLIATATGLMLLVVVPVLVLTFYIAWKYHEDNNATYTPDWDHSLKLETIWWGFPCLIIVILAGLAWQSSHQLDPFKPLTSATTKPMTIEVVALPWKWLFIYPEQDIASLNYVRFPANTPINFVITADAPMNSFWIPQLGGQIYAMPGMSTQLHLEASQIGSYQGVSANISGEGFAGMKFTATSTSEADFNQWVRDIKASNHNLGYVGYEGLAEPSTNNPVSYYGSVEKNLYTAILMKYMGNTGDMPNMQLSNQYIQNVNQ